MLGIPRVAAVLALTALAACGQKDSAPGPTAAATTTATAAKTKAAYRQVAIGHRHACALTGDGKLICWGGQGRARANRR